jgi:hypothetical protein
MCEVEIDATEESREFGRKLGFDQAMSTGFESDADRIAGRAIVDLFDNDAVDVPRAHLRQEVRRLSGLVGRHGGCSKE